MKCATALMSRVSAIPSHGWADPNLCEIDRSDKLTGRGLVATSYNFVGIKMNSVAAVPHSRK